MTTDQAVRETTVRRLARAVLTMAVRGRKPRGGDWGEAILTEFAQTTGDWEAVRWAAGGLRAVRHERRSRALQLPRIVRIRRRAALIVLIGIVGGLVVNRYALSVGIILTSSMEPTYQVTDRYLMDRLAFRLTGVHYGDVVEFTLPDNGGRPVQRVIGLPGDTIECRDGRVWRNGTPLDEPYLPAAPEEAHTDCQAVTVPPHRLYLLGDHRAISRDSRQEGTVNQDDVNGKILLRL